MDISMEISTAGDPLVEISMGIFADGDSKVRIFFLWGWGWGWGWRLCPPLCRGYPP